MKRKLKGSALLPLATLAAVAALGLLGWRWAQLHQPDRHVVAVPVTPQPQGPASAPATASAAASAPAEPGATVAANEPIEEVHESPDSETTLERIIPRQSNAHAQGLDKHPDPLRLDASVALVMDAQEGKVLYAKNEQAVLPIASVTKLMTAVVTLEAKLKMDEMITITDEDVDNERHSRSRLRVGTTLSRDEALHLALMSSENRAAHALGRTYPGGLAAFVKAMNAKAKALGMTSTSYVDPTGLSSGNQSTAHDLAVLVGTAAKYPLLRQYSTTPQYLTRVGKSVLRYNNSNRLVKDSRWDIELQKTGYIIEAGHCVVMKTSVAGKNVVMVLLDADNNNRRNADAERLRRWLGGDPPPKVAAAKPRKAARAQARRDAGKAPTRTADAKGKSKEKDKDKGKAKNKGRDKDDTRVADDKPEGKRAATDKRVKVTLPSPKLAHAGSHE